MKKKQSDKKCFVIELPLITDKYQEDIINARMECGRLIYNAMLRVVIKRYGEMTKTKIYRNLIESLTGDEKADKVIWEQINELESKYKLTQATLYKDVKTMQHHYKNHINSLMAQDIVDRIIQALDNIKTHKGEEFHFKKYGQLNSLASKNTATGIRYIGNKIYWQNLVLSIKFPTSPNSAIYIEQNFYPNLIHLKFCRIVRKEIRGKYKYYVQFVFDGVPHRNRYKLGKGRVGIDIGTSTVAVASDNVVELQELASNVQDLEKQKKVLQRKMNRSSRANNPNKYNSDGTIKKGNKDKWINSNHYIKYRQQLRELYRKQRIARRLQHGILSNYILSLGDEFYVEKMNFKALQKRSKKPTEYKANGKCKRKKRFGKSIGNRAPALLLQLLSNKLSYFNLQLQEINTQTCKASQFNHTTQTYTKKSLSQRWNIIEDAPVQRDLYSAFLISNVINTLDKIDVDLCNQKYDNFLQLHNNKIIELREEKQQTRRKFLSCMGI